MSQSSDSSLLFSDAASLEEQSLYRKCDQIFVSDESKTDVQVRKTCPGESSQSFQFGRSITGQGMDGGQSVLEVYQNTDNSQWFFFISQAHTWSRLNVSHGLFRQLCHGLQIMPQSAEIVSAFGARTTDDDEYFTTCHRQKIWGAQNDSTGAFRRSDICYNIRFVERHGRDGLKDPWSFRQVAVYHSYDYERKKCSWVFIQLPKAVIASIVREAKPHSPLLIHWLIRHYCASEWRWYINYLSDLVSTMRDVSCFTRVDQDLEGLPLDFQQSQKLEVLRNKIRRVNLLLGSCISTTESLMAHATECYCQEDGDERNGNRSSEILLEFGQHVDVLKMHKAKASSLLESTQSIDFLTTKVLEFRQNHMTYNLNVSMENISRSMSNENKLMASTADQTRQDSKTIKTISIIALVYLPATLLSSVFSSELVQPISNTKGRAGGYGTLIGIYILLTFSLTIITLLAAKLWERKTG